MIVHCPRCARRIPASDMNVATDVAVCQGCDGAFQLSEIVARANEAELEPPPPGAFFEELPDGFRVGATTRSVQAFFLVPFAIVWSGATVGGIYGTQIAMGEFEPLMSLFGLPFFVGSVVLWSHVLMLVGGKCVLTVRNGEAETFTGIGRLGLRKRFPWSYVRSVEEVTHDGGPSRMRGPCLFLEGRTRVPFAARMSEARRFFLRNALRRKLHRPNVSEMLGYRSA